MVQEHPWSVQGEVSGATTAHSHRCPSHHPIAPPFPPIPNIRYACLQCGRHGTTYSPAPRRNKGRQKLRRKTQSLTQSLGVSAIRRRPPARPRHAVGVAPTFEPFARYVLTEHASFLLSENPGRKEKRKGMPLAPPKIDAPFDAALFHFGKVAPREVLLYFRDPDVR